MEIHLRVTRHSIGNFPSIFLLNVANSRRKSAFSLKSRLVLHKGNILTTPIRVFLADDHRILVDGFKHILVDYGLNVVDVAYSLDELMCKYPLTKFDALVIDIRFDNKNVAKNGLDACQEIISTHKDAKIVVFSQFDDLWIIERAYKAGALAFVRKDEPYEILHEAICHAAKGERYVSPVIAQKVALSTINDQNPKSLLSAIELKAFELYANGALFKDIASELKVTEKTVGLYFKSIKDKLSIESQADATKLAIMYGITTTSLHGD